MLTRRVKIPATRQTGRIVRLPPWQKPPRGTLLNLSHPLAKGLKYAIPINEGAGTIHNVLMPDDIFTPGSDAGSLPTWEITEKGYSQFFTYQFGNFNNYIRSSDNCPITGASPLSVFVLFYITQLESTIQTIVSWGTDAANGYLFRLSMDASGRITVQCKGGNATGTTTNLHGAWRTFGASLNTSDIADARLFVDGIEESTSTASQTINIQPSVLSFSEITPLDGERGFGGHLALAYIWDRALSASEIAQLHLEPYAMFQRERMASFLVPTYTIEVEATYTKSLDLDAILRAVKSKGLDLDAVLTAFQTLDVDVDLDAILRLTKSKVLDLDAILRLTRINTVDLDAILRLVKTEDVDLDAILRLAKSRGVDLDSILRISKLSTLDLDAILSLALETQTKTLEVTADVYDMLGWAWGHSNTSFVEIPEKWTVWKAVGGGAATYDTAYGLLQLKSGETFYSDVKDIGSVADRLLTIDIDKYGSGSGTQGTIEWRGSTTSFAWDDGSPSWSVYPPGGSVENWRYVQVRVTG